MLSSLSATGLGVLMLVLFAVFYFLGIFATNPNTTGFSYPHLFSAPFQITVGDGQDLGDNPGDGTPEVPLAIGLPLAALAVVGGFTILNTFSIIVGQRTRELALLRIAGASRRQVLVAAL